ncbi:MAG TPA: hypothetical protein VJL84_04210 [Kiloniellales bacterium]|nr:hypothetical protein [Kiloniellales bacterium]
MRLVILAGAVVLAPLPAAAALDLWVCEPAERLVCEAGTGCTAASPQIAQVQIMPVTGSIEFCIAEQCYQGVLQLEKEGWPDYREMGTATVEALPLPRAYTPGEPWFAAFDETRRRFTLSLLGLQSQDTTWFDCRPWTE